MSISEIESTCRMIDKCIITMTNLAAKDAKFNREYARVNVSRLTKLKENCIRDLGYLNA